MTWFKVDDSFHSHPKVIATEPAALGLWVIAGSWCSANLTDGFVPDHVLPRLLPGATKLAKKLIAAGLWVRAERGYLFHDWRSFNPTADQIRAEREAAAERQRRFRANQSNARNGVRNGVTYGVTSPSVTGPRPVPGPSRGTSGGESHQSNAHAKQPPPQRPRCAQHQHLPDSDPGPPCHGCKAERLATEQRERDERTDALAVVRSWRELVDACPECDDNGYIETTNGQVRHHGKPGQLRSVS